MFFSKNKIKFNIIKQNGKAIRSISGNDHTNFFHYKNIQSFILLKSIALTISSEAVFNEDGSFSREFTIKKAELADAHNLKSSQFKKDRLLKTKDMFDQYASFTFKDDNDITFKILESFEMDAKGNIKGIFTEEFFKYVKTIEKMYKLPTCIKSLSPLHIWLYTFFRNNDGWYIYTLDSLRKQLGITDNPQRFYQQIIKALKDMEHLTNDAGKNIINHLILVDDTSFKVCMNTKNKDLKIADVMQNVEIIEMPNTHVKLAVRLDEEKTELVKKVYEIEEFDIKAIYKLFKSIRIERNRKNKKLNKKKNTTQNIVVNKNKKLNKDIENSPAEPFVGTSNEVSNQEIATHTNNNFITYNEYTSTVIDQERTINVSKDNGDNLFEKIKAIYDKNIKDKQDKKEEQVEDFNLEGVDIILPIENKDDELPF